MGGEHHVGLRFVMRSFSSFFWATLAAGAIVALAGCSGGGSVAPNGGLAPGIDVGASGYRGQAHASHSLLKHVLSGLFIANLTTGEDVVLQNGTWRGLGTIQDGIGRQAGNWVDNKGNFFQTNYNSGQVVEYGFNQRHPKFTYTGFSDPTVVTSDREGNVFVGDYNSGSNGSIAQFKDGNDTPVQKCSLPGGIEGVAVDSNHDIFVAYNNLSGQGNLVRFAGGLAGCSASTLRVGLGFAGGLVLDGHHNLIAVDQRNHVVDVIRPPYSRVGNTFRLPLFQPFRVALNRQENRLFVCESPHQFVDVLDYPSGKLLIALGSRNGLARPQGVTDEPNAVF
jgi:hypothetical protein